MRRARVLVLLGCLGALSIGGMPTAGGASAECAAAPPADFADPPTSDGTVGFVGGYWYTEPIPEVGSGPGTDATVEALVARTAARVEAIRCVNIDGPPPVRSVNRSDLDDTLTSLYADISAAERRFDNAKLAVLLLVPVEADSIAQRRANQKVAVQGYYDIGTDRIMRPETYPTFEPQSPPITDRSTARWQPLHLPDRPDYGVFGPVGIAASLMAPQFDNKTTEVGIPPYAYSHPVVDAWRGDRLRVYTTATRQTAAVWKSRWADAEAAEEYTDEYTAVLEFYGATPVGETVFRFDETAEYTGSVRVTQTNATVTIVKAPSADALDAVHASDGSVQQTARTPGFGPLGAVVAVLWAVWYRVRSQP